MPPGSTADIDLYTYVWAIRLILWIPSDWMGNLEVPGTLLMPQIIEQPVQRCLSRLPALLLGKRPVQPRLVKHPELAYPYGGVAAKPGNFGCRRNQRHHSKCVLFPVASSGALCYSRPSANAR